jgi:hypothetical protein
MPVRVLTVGDVQNHLKEKGFTETNVTTNTGTFWRSECGNHVLVPFPDGDVYPDFILEELIKVVGKIIPRPLH